jgi:hypothetical protein
LVTAGRPLKARDAPSHRNAVHLISPTGATSEATSGDAGMQGLEDARRKWNGDLTSPVCGTEDCYMEAASSSPTFLPLFFFGWLGWLARRWWWWGEGSVFDWWVGPGGNERANLGRRFGGGHNTRGRHAKAATPSTYSLPVISSRVLFYPTASAPVRRRRRATRRCGARGCPAPARCLALP